MFYYFHPSDKNECQDFPFPLLLSSDLPALQSALAFDQRVESTLDDLAKHFETHLDLDEFFALAQAG